MSDEPAANAPLPAVPARDSGQPLGGEHASDAGLAALRGRDVGRMVRTVLVPEGAGWYSEISVLGEAR
jgi:hypothetical protein